MKKITLLCAAGMSTSMLVKAMQKAAAEKLAQKQERNEAKAAEAQKEENV